MSWIKIDDTTFAKEATPDPVEVVDISELEAEIAELQSRIDSIHLIEIPKGASEELVRAINKWNEEMYIPDINQKTMELNLKINTLREIQDGSNI